MYKIKKTFEIAVSHRLNLPYDSPCKRDHGHNISITVYCASRELNPEGMVIDFTEIKKVVHGQLDHRCLNNIEGLGYEIREPQFDPSKQYEKKRIELNPTAERLAKWIFMQIDNCYRVDVQESVGNVAVYEDE